MVLRAGARVVLEIDEPLGSNTSKLGDHFKLHLVAAVVIDGRTLLPAGTPGVGEVVHIARSALGGRPGELIVMARYLDVDGVHVPLGHFRFGDTGKDNSTASLIAMEAIGLPGVLITGGQVKILAGTRGNARTSADVTLPPTKPSSNPPQESVQ